jgi:hypothetical protein
LDLLLGPTEKMLSPKGDLMRTIAIATVAALVLSGCAGPAVAPTGGYSMPPAPPAEKVIWLRTDGQSGKNNPAIAQQFAADKAACGNGIDVDRGCMAQRGYLLVPESQVEAKAAELRAAARSTPPQ